MYGFVRLTRTTRGRRLALSAVLDDYCRTHELRMAALFVEHAPDDFYSPAFVGLLDTLALADAYGVVVPSLVHLGPARTATDRARIILSAGARLIQVRLTATGMRPVGTGVIAAHRTSALKVSRLLRTRREEPLS
ncbi:hypothetical protein C8250_039115 [Streptomyces sp. So13.3]|uniref:hypothetical protein n=2 Tax=Streptomyces TaxID=1883 RepID=UPI001106BA8A|nr:MULTISPECIES: hypothetical protein [unclassified Streptomyces]MCZ4102950.1 hypothetical protein [Streptomyces sp. H39-C1]QNA77070.1 hypothetical protein C8250_039115 [Streptomyces sp. So13.3]